MRIPVFLTLFAAVALPVDANAREAPAVMQLAVRAGANVQPLACEKKPALVRPAAEPNPDPLEIPSEDMLDELPAPPLDVPTAANSPLSSLRALPSNEGFRIAIWGDSHLAANFFTEELAKLLKIPGDALPNLLIPANMGKAGVRLPLRQSCVSPQWKYEPVYVSGEGTTAPGPGLVNMVSDQAGATLAWDVRKDAQSPGYERVRVLYQQTEAPMLVAVSVDGGAEQEVTLQQKAGPAVLELAADAPLAQVRLRLVDGRLRFHGLELASAQSKPYVLDVFGYPGATAASWRSANQDYLRAWFAQRQYQLVMLEFGTNEGNVKPFDLAAYRKMLTESVRNMKATFPTAACVLIGPGDRGVLVPRSLNVRRKGAGADRKAGKKAGKKAARIAAAKGAKSGRKRAAVDLFQYSTIHAAINRVQAEVAQDAGCLAWSMQDAMGGPGRAYGWAQQSPALMSKDLIHFTVAGYRRLAQEFAKDMGWTDAPAP
ncbi:GDSL-type esterase/lipase family protein [Massilia sp. Se16.2.3]|uniref:GDSL-type esterase/lipase family protein n=1 Tax=Massilia sp. Se16.2.3 TaxID=2709303 RepID=UPI001602C6D3|nr:GDSL-type esterase/lipase family protein [Massilia sp. Se16.2.3]QNB00857.1 hypothetical protein G4G31_21940 [Massilia sp. Se16.2.3]